MRSRSDDPWPAHHPAGDANAPDTFHRMNTASLSKPGALVQARGREWVVLPESTAELLMLRPVGGLDEEVTGLLPTVEPIASATFRLLGREDLGDFASGRRLRDTVRLSTRAATAGWIGDRPPGTGRPGDLAGARAGDWRGPRPWCAVEAPVVQPCRGLGLFRLIRQLPENRIEGVPHLSHCFDEPGPGIGPAFLIGHPDFARVVE